MNDKCPKCGGKVSEVGSWLGPIMSHEPNDVTCLRNQLAQLHEQLAKTEVELERYKDAWFLLKDALTDDMEFWTNVNWYRVAQIHTIISHMDKLILQN